MKKYIGKIIDHGIKPNSKNNPQVVIKFEYKDQNGMLETINSYFQLTGGAKKITLEKLVEIGFNSNDVFDLIRTSSNDSLKFKGQELELVIDTEIYQGKEKRYVKYINIPGKNEFSNQFVKSKEEAIKKMPGLANLKGELLDARQKIDAVKEEIEEEIPF